MKNRLLFIVFLLFIGVGRLFCQSFNYGVPSEYRVHITPTFEERPTEGKQEFMLVLPQNYYVEMFKKVYTKCLDESQINILKNRGLIVQMYVNNNGEVFYVNFRLKKELQKLVDEQELLTIYKALKKVKLDFSKGYTTPSQNTLTDKYFAKIEGPFIL